MGSEWLRPGGGSDGRPDARSVRGRAQRAMGGGELLAFVELLEPKKLEKHF